jgi:uncharacterized protein YbaR (Trm112 family)
MIDARLLEILCCPLGKASLKLENDFLVCTKCNVIYPIIEGIPSLLIEDAILPAGIKSIPELICQKKIQSE